MYIEDLDLDEINGLSYGIPPSVCEFHLVLTFEALCFAPEYWALSQISAYFTLRHRTELRLF